MTTPEAFARENGTWPNSCFGDGRSDKGNCTAGRGEVHGYQGLPKGSVRKGYLGNQGAGYGGTADIGKDASGNVVCGGVAAQCSLADANVRVSLVEGESRL